MCFHRRHEIADAACAEVHIATFCGRLPQVRLITERVAEIARGAVTSPTPVPGGVRPVLAVAVAAADAYIRDICGSSQETAMSTTAR